MNSLMLIAKEETLQEGNQVHKIIAADLMKRERASLPIYKGGLESRGKFPTLTPQRNPSPKTTVSLVAFVLLTPFHRLAQRSAGRKNSNVAGQGMSNAGRGTVSAVPKKGTEAETSRQARTTRRVLSETIVGGFFVCLDDHTGTGVCLRCGDR